MLNLFHSFYLHNSVAEFIYFECNQKKISDNSGLWVRANNLLNIHFITLKEFE